MQKEFNKNNDNTKRSGVSDEQILKEIEAMKNRSSNKDKVLEDLKDKEFTHKDSVVEIASKKNKEQITEYTKPTLENGTKLYNGTELEFERSVLKKMIIWFSVISFIFLAIVFTLFGVGTTFPYGSNLTIVFEIIDIVLSIIYGCLTYAFFAIFFKKQRDYVKLLTHLDTGLLNKTEGIFISNESETCTKEGVVFNTLNINVFNNSKGEYFERKILVDKEKSLPVFNENDNVIFITQGSVLVEYEVVSKSKTQEEPLKED